MGVNLTPIIVKQVVELPHLAGRGLAIDASTELYQFLALIRTRDGSPLQDAQGRVTSHLTGLLFRTTRLISDYDIQPIFVFDGAPPPLKRETLEQRRQLKARAAKEWEEARRRGDYATAWSKAVVTSRLTDAMVKDAQRLLTLLGIPWLHAPGEAEAQAAHMAQQGVVWACSSKDYDSLLFGAPRLVRYVTIAGREFLPSRGISRPLKPEIIELPLLLTSLGLTREQLIDAAILIGTDFNRGIRGIGPKTAVQLLRQFGSLEALPFELQQKLPSNYQEVRSLFLHPPVTNQYHPQPTEPQEDELYRFLCDERGFSKPRVRTVIERLRRGAEPLQAKLTEF